MGTSLSAAGADYQGLAKAFFGDMSTTTQQDLWTRFLTLNGLTTNPTDDSKLDDFVSFIQTEYRDGFASLPLSPEEIAKRAIVFNCFNIVLQMLSTLQNTAATQSQFLIYLAKLQQEYTKQIAAIPSYVANPVAKTGSGNQEIWGAIDPALAQITPPGSVSNENGFFFTNALYASLDSNGYIIPTSAAAQAVDPADFKMGYANISLLDIGSYMATSAPGTTFNIAGPQTVVNCFNSAGQNVGTGRVNIYMTFVTPETGSTDPAFVQFNVQFLNADGTVRRFDDGGLVSFPFATQKVLTTDANGAPLSPTSDQLAKNWGLAAEALIQKYLGSTTGSQTSDPSQVIKATLGATPAIAAFTGLPGTATSFSVESTLSIPWRYTEPWRDPGSDSTRTGQNAAASQKRGELNAQMQQYIQNITSYRQAARDLATQMQTNLSQTKESITNMSNLLTSMIQTMSGILNSVFR